jgi:uncharacterized membrane protein
MKTSMKLTYGSKTDLCIMYLSFLPWAILAAIPLGIGFIWLHPYMEVSFVHAYHSLKDQALASGAVTDKDFEKGTA